jgi:hypothetical protein
LCCSGLLNCTLCGMQVQNADDAGATEIGFLLDEQQYASNSILGRKSSRALLPRSLLETRVAFFGGGSGPARVVSRPDACCADARHVPYCICHPVVRAE